MPENYILLERTELNATAASVTFASIPQTGYTDLVIKLSSRADTAGPQNIGISLNGSTTGFTNRLLYGDGSAAASSTTSTIYQGIVPGTAYTSNVFGNAEIYIPNYTGSTNKSYTSDSVTENNATASYTVLSAGLWSNTAAITSITLNCGPTSNWVSGSTFSLYGIAAVGTTPVIAPKASGGNRIDNDGTYWYHTFTSSGTFTPQVGLSCDVLVVAGGGGGGRSFGGGGGAGGLLGFTGQTVSALQNVTIGAGGPNQGGSAFVGNDGSDSQFGSLTLVKGGGGGGYDAGGGVGSNGRTGGSGGGGSRVGFGTGGAPTTSQGFRGGNQTGTGGTGGGGAGATGQDLSGSSGTGGNGSSAYSSWGAATLTGQNVSGTYWYAGGGGGQAGAGGNGGGGQNIDGLSTTVANGTINTGGGGGGDTVNSSGGSGIIIVRYPIA
jgi:hypothetical protein